MSDKPAPPTEAPPGATRRSEARKTRRQLLKALALAVPGAAGAAVGLGRAASAAREDSGHFSGDPGVLRERFLAEARATEAVAVAEADPAVRERVQGVIPADALPRPSVSASPAPAPVRESPIIRMQGDVQRAMQKPVEERTWVMAIDLRKCIGCSACTIGCKAENQLPPGVVYRPVIDLEIGEYPNVSRQFIPRPCMQCDDPPCVPVCPVGATYKRPDGVVEIDYNRCIGCRYCIPACPYAARTFDFGEYYTDDTPARQAYEESTSPEYGKAWKRGEGSSPVGNVRKCQFCLHRLEVGMLPACVTTCIGGATFFGDRKDPDSLINELIHRPNVIRLKEELGTDPKVYYLL